MNDIKGYTMNQVIGFTNAIKISRAETMKQDFYSARISHHGEKEAVEKFLKGLSGEKQKSFSKIPKQFIK